MEFTVRAAADFDAVEAAVCRALSREGERCAFVRSAQFVRFRVRVLYRGHEGRLTVCPQDGKLALDFDPPHSVTVRAVEDVRVRRDTDCVYCDEQEDPGRGKRRRGRKRRRVRRGEEER